MDALRLETPETESVRPLVAEDLKRGDYVAILNETGEYPSFLWDLDALVAPPNEPVRVRWRSPAAGIPLKVRAICLPFVFVQSPCGKHQTLDLRRCQLVRLSRRYAKRAWRTLVKEMAMTSLRI